MNVTPGWQEPSWVDSVEIGSLMWLFYSWWKIQVTNPDLSDFGAFALNYYPALLSRCICPLPGKTGEGSAMEVRFFSLSPYSANRY